MSKLFSNPDAPIILIVFVILYVLNAIGDWKLFEKSYVPTWHAFIPFLRKYDEFDLCWDKSLGLYYVAYYIVGGLLRLYCYDKDLMLMAIIATLLLTCTVVLQIQKAVRLAMSFGKDRMFAMGLILLEPIFLMIIGFDNSQYLGKQELLGLR